MSASVKSVAASASVNVITAVSPALSDARLDEIATVGATVSTSGGAASAAAALTLPAASLNTPAATDTAAGPTKPAAGTNVAE